MRIALLIVAYGIAVAVHSYITSFTFGFNILKDNAWAVDVVGIGAPMIMCILTIAKAKPFIVAAIPVVMWAGLTGIAGFMPPVLSIVAVVFLAVTGFGIATGWRRSDIESE